MKKIVNMLIVTMVVLSLMACGGQAEEQSVSQEVVQSQENDTVTTERENDELKTISVDEPQNVSEESEDDTTVDIEIVETEYDDTALESVLQGICDDYATTIQYINDEKEKTFDAVGESYAEYVENKQRVADLYALVISESESLFERTKECSVEYFKMVVSFIDHSDYDALETYYDVIYEDAMGDYYDAIYVNFMDTMFDKYYNGIVSEGFSSVEYSEWLSESSAAYSDWLEAGSDIYELWLDAQSLFFSMYLEVNSGIYMQNYDIDKIMEELLAEEEAVNTEKDQEESRNESQNMDEEVDNTIVAGDVDPDFKAMMDSYEAFFDEYMEFMNKYMEADTEEMLGMTSDYTEYLTQYAETMEKMSEVDTSTLSAADALYYTEVTARIYAKMLEVSY